MSYDSVPEFVVLIEQDQWKQSVEDIQGEVLCGRCFNLTLRFVTTWPDHRYQSITVHFDGWHQEKSTRLP